MIQRVFTITFNRYYPEHNGAAKIFHEDINLAFKNTKARFYIINFRDVKQKTTKVRKQGRTVVIPIKNKLIFSMTNLRLLYFLAIAFKLALRIRGERLHILTVTWAGLIIGYSLAGMFKKYSVESTLYGDIDTPRRLPKIFDLTKQKLKKFLIRRADIIKVYSQLQKNEFSKLSIHNIDIVPPILHDEHYHRVNASEKMLIREKLSLRPNRHLFLFVGALSVRKGYDIFVDAIKQFNANPALVNKADFVLVGPPVYGCEQLPFENVHYVGYSDNVPEYMQACDTFVLPSRSEGFGRVYIEALACGLIPLTTHLKGVNDYLGEITDFVDLNPSAYKNAFCKRICQRAESDTGPNINEYNRVLHGYRKEVVVGKLKNYYEVK